MTITAQERFLHTITAWSTYTQPGRQWKAMNGHLFNIDLADLELVTR